MSKDVQVVVDPELKALLIPLAPDERDGLRKSLRRHGCLHPLIAWRENGKRLLLDGNNRKELCELDGIQYGVREIELPSREAAKLWIEEHQAARRNLSDQAKLALWDSIFERRSKLAVQEQRRQAGKAGGRGRPKNSGPETVSDPLSKNAKGKKKDTRAAVAEEGKISEWKLRGYRALKNKAVAVLGQQEADSLMLKIRHDEIKMNVAKRDVFRAEHAKKLAAVKSVVRPDIETCDLRVCSMEELLGKVRGLDAIICDPPYGKEFVPLYGTLAKLAKKALKPNGVLAVMCGQSHLFEVGTAMMRHINYRWEMAYLTPGGQSAQIWDRHVNTFWKPVLVFQQADDARWIGDVVKSDDNDKRYHEWGQSESGMGRLVERLTDPGQLIADPFLGGGTTAVAALKLHRRIIGCDIDPDMVKTAQSRVAKALAERVQ